jgi:hypothetical protein
MNIKFENLVGKTGILCAVDSNKFNLKYNENNS